MLKLGPFATFGNEYRIMKGDNVSCVKLSSKVCQKWIQYYATRNAYDEWYINLASGNEFEIFLSCLLFP